MGRLLAALAAAWHGCRDQPSKEHPLSIPGDLDGDPIPRRSSRGAARQVNVLVVDDQPVFRRAARRLIAATPGFEPVGEAASGAHALELAADLRPDLVLVDVRMPGMDGIETARRLARAEPYATVVLISLEQGPELPSAVRSAGAAAYVRKQDLTTSALRELWAQLAAGAGRPT